jgi:hypothetical protein
MRSTIRPLAHGWGATKTKKQVATLFAIAAAVTLGAGVVALPGAKPRPVQASPSEANPVLSPEAVPLPSSHEEAKVPGTAAVARARVVGTIVRDEASVMTELHRLGEDNPALSLLLAREGNDRFPRSAEAPERGWILVKSLVNMRRFDEAKAEAVIMVDKYRGTSWAADVERHLLVNPLYPKESEPP